jgi:hypothetical protein
VRFAPCMDRNYGLWSKGAFGVKIEMCPFWLAIESPPEGCHYGRSGMMGVVRYFHGNGQLVDMWCANACHQLYQCGIFEPEVDRLPAPVPQESSTPRSSIFTGYETIQNLPSRPGLCDFVWRGLAANNSSAVSGEKAPAETCASSLCRIVVSVQTCTPLCRMISASALVRRV